MRHYAKRQLTWFRHQAESKRVDLAADMDSNLETVLAGLGNAAGSPGGGLP